MPSTHLSPRRTRRSSTPSLPTEVIHKVLSLAIQPSSFSGAQILRVCKRFNVIGKVFLWEKMVIKSVKGSESVQKLWDERNCHKIGGRGLWHLVQHLKLIFPKNAPGFSTVLSLKFTEEFFTNLRCLEMIDSEVIKGKASTTVLGVQSRLSAFLVSLSPKKLIWHLNSPEIPEGNYMTGTTTDSEREQLRLFYSTTLKVLEVDAMGIGGLARILSGPSSIHTLKINERNQQHHGQARRSTMYHIKQLFTEHLALFPNLKQLIVTPQNETTYGKIRYMLLLLGRIIEREGIEVVIVGYEEDYQHAVKEAKAKVAIAAAGPPTTAPTTQIEDSNVVL